MSEPEQERFSRFIHQLFVEQSRRGRGQLAQADGSAEVFGILFGYGSDSR